MPSRDQLHVFALLTDGVGGKGGIARYNQDLVTALSRSSRVSAISILPRFGQTNAVLPLGVTQHAPAAGKLAWSARALALTVRQRFDLIFCGHLNAVALAAIIAKLMRAPLWVQVHGIEAWPTRGHAIRKGLEAATLVTSVSRYTRKRLLEWNELPPHRVRVLPNTFAANLAPSITPTDISTRHGLAGKRVILTVGRLATSERYKGHDRIIRSLRGILQQVPDAVYLIVGSGDDKPRLQQLAEQTDVSSYVLFAGEVPATELPDYFAVADVFAMPSTGEGFGIVFLEAAASGLPVIGGNCDGSLDALADEAIGRAIDPKSSEELVAALVDALQGRAAVAPERAQRFAFANFANHVDELVKTVAC